MHRFGKILIGLCLGWGAMGMALSVSELPSIEVVRACLIPSDGHITSAEREKWAAYLGWQSCAEIALCQGAYVQPVITPIRDAQQLQLEADHMHVQMTGRSVLKGHVSVRRLDQRLEANTAYIYRDVKTNTLQKIKLVEGLRVITPSALLVAQTGTYSPVTQALSLEDALYRLNTQRHGARLAGWGVAKSLFRDKTGISVLQQASYSHCSPLDPSWEIRARQLTLNPAKNEGTARNATLRLYNIPLVYSPYLTFPLSKKRKSGFLMPIMGSTTVNGIDIATPYYLNLAPNYDATFVPHLYTKRGVMAGGAFRYLTPQAQGAMVGNILPKDRAYGQFLRQNNLDNASTRWDIQWKESRQLGSPQLTWQVDARQLSDSYYLQDFSTNLERMTERQILREGMIAYTTPHWLLDAKVQSYQTLHPINETPVANAYERLPQLLALGEYDALPLETQFKFTGTFDYFRWPTALTYSPDALRYHANPILSWERRQSFGYITPAVQWVGNAYQFPGQQGVTSRQVDVSLPRYSLDTGVTFERAATHWTQTLEPRLYYLNVPYHNQSQVPAFDAGYMIFTTNQVFRDNRFSGFDRIGDANQLGYGVTTRFLSTASGQERLSLTAAQLRYFSDRKVFLCDAPGGVCTQDPMTLGFLSPTESFSPIAANMTYRVDESWSLVGDYAWDPATSATNNTQVNLHFQAEGNRIFNAGYGYLVNGDMTQVGTTAWQDKALNQISASYAWPFNDSWSSLGGYSYNISKQYQMMSFLGIQYDRCCWALRLLGGRTFRSLNPATALPQYTNSVFVQILLKGLGSVGTNDPTSTLRTYLPTYQDPFKA